MDSGQYSASGASKNREGRLIIMMIEQYIERYLPVGTDTVKQDVYFDTATILRGCAGPRDWTEEDFQAVEFLSKRVEISRCVYDGYLETGARASSKRLPAELLPLALLVLFKDFRRLAALGINASAIKRLNATLRLLDCLGTEKIVLAQELTTLIETEVAAFLDAFQPTPSHATEGLLTDVKVTADSALPLTVLFWEGPIARAYLATLKSMGLRPEKIIHLVSRNDLSTKKPVGRFLPGVMRLAYAQSKQKNSIHHWAAVLKKNETSLYQQVRNTVETGLAFSAAVVDDALALGDLAGYSSNVETLMIDNLADEALYARLAALPETRILFTGGGIVPKRLLHLPALKFIHIHPGYLPEVRGADCALWSQLMLGRTSATCFYLAPGIDDGDVILPGYLPSLDFNMASADINLKTLYRVTYAFFDPWIRACVLRRALALTQGFTKIAAYPQSEESSVTYHFMHEKIQRVAFDRLFAAKPSALGA